MNDRFLPMIDESVPVQMYGKHIYGIGLNGCFVQVLHRYLFSTTTRIPDRLRQILIEAGTNVMENAISIETKPELSPWVWYKGALNQYHSALLLLVEVYAYPMRKDAARIWKCLDYIFDIPPHLSPKQKAELVLTDLRDRMEAYHQMRKIKTTTQMEERVRAMTQSSVRDPTGPPLSSFANVNNAGFNLSGDQTIGSMPTMLPAEFSPPPAAPTESSGSDSRQGSIAMSRDVQMGDMDDIDWVSLYVLSRKEIMLIVSQAEWDKYFPIEQNTGDLNIPDFNIADFTQPMDPTAFGSTTGPGVNISSVQDLTDVNFTPTYYPTNMPGQANQPNYYNG